MLKVAFYESPNKTALFCKVLSFWEVTICGTRSKERKILQAMERDILLPSTPLWVGWQKFIPFRLLGRSPNPRQSAGATLTEHHKIVVATLRL